MENATYREYVERMKKASDPTTYPWPNDCEDWHVRADNILCEFLTELGYTELVSAFDEVPKWYA